MKTHLDYYHKGDAIPLIIEALTKAGYRIRQEEQIKSWNQPRMTHYNILRGINFCKLRGYKTLVYTNTVLLKERLSKEYNITILDIHDLRIIANERCVYKLLDYLM